MFLLWDTGGIKWDCCISLLINNMKAFRCISREGSWQNRPEILIHINNTVALFTHFRTQIRRWKWVYEIPAAGGVTESFPCIIRENENQ